MAPPPGLPLILASGSPRRRELLEGIGLRFEVRPPDIPEQRLPGEAPARLVERLAREKALAVARRLGPQDPRWVLAADTVVVLGDEVIGKPEDAEHALALLGRLVGRRHRVLTGVALVASDTLETRGTVVESRVQMRPASEPELRAYVAGGEPLDKAGAYAAQGDGRHLIERIEGSESNVIGLPLDETLELLRAAGLDAAPGIRERLASVRERIARAAARAGRDASEVTLVGVAKGQPAEAVAAALACGLGAVGESYVQEAVPKLETLRASGAVPARWHFVGRLQRNKVRQVVPHFDMVETLDRASLGAELERRAAAAGRRLDVLVQANLSGEAQKGGVAPGELPALLAASRAWPHLRVTGLMTVPAQTPDPERSRPVFARLRDLAASLRAAPGGENLRELSMGMSADFEVAVEEGATLVRVGTALFGPRDSAGPRAR